MTLMSLLDSMSLFALQPFLKEEGLGCCPSLAVRSSWIGVFSLPGQFTLSSCSCVWLLWLFIVFCFLYRFSCLLLVVCCLLCVVVCCLLFVVVCVMLLFAGVKHVVRLWPESSQVTSSPPQQRSGQEHGGCLISARLEGGQRLPDFHAPESWFAYWVELPQWSYDRVSLGGPTGLRMFMV